MSRNPLLEILGIRFPIIQAPLGGPWPPMFELTAAVSNAGALGSHATAFQSRTEVKKQIGHIRDLTDRPFVVNFTMRPFDPDVFAEVLQARPHAVSLALGDPGELTKRAHDVGIVFVQQVHTVSQARRVAERGVDVIVAQGTEAGGFTGNVSTMALVPQVVDAVRPIPVVAAGGVADGRGLAAALALGAQGVNVGTRFMASRESTIAEEWKHSIVAAESEGAVKADFMPTLFPGSDEGSYEVVPRSLRTTFVDEWNRRLPDLEREAERLRAELAAAMRAGRAHEYVPLTGQSAGLVHEILPAAEIVRRMVSDAESTLRGALDGAQAYAG